MLCFETFLKDHKWHGNNLGKDTYKFNYTLHSYVISKHIHRPEAYISPSIVNEANKSQH
jgi:hypothetical protein